jgi:hypothetical protein
MATKLKALRDTQRALRATFDAQKKLEWAELTSELEARITSEINRLYRAGMKVAAIQREYGTSDYRTVKDRILTVTSNNIVTDLLGLVWTCVKEPNTWEVTDGTHRATVVVLEDEEVVVLSKTTDPAFGEAVNMEAGYKQWQNRTAGS